MGLHAAIIRLSPVKHEGEQRYKPYIVGDPRMVTLPLTNPGYAPGHLKIGANWCRLLRVSSKLPDNLGELNIYAMSQTWSVTGLIHSPIIDKKLMKLLK